MERNRVLYLDCLRCVSVFAMMLLHVAALNWGNIDVTSFEWQCFNVYDSLVRFCVPIFIMISGVFFLDNSREVSMCKLFTKNILRIIVAFLFWSFCYSFSINLLKSVMNIEKFSAKDFIVDILIGHYHMWFLFTLVALYLMVPVLRRITQDKQITEYFLILSFVFCFCLNILKICPETELVYDMLLTKTNIFLPLGYSGYFVLGYYLHKYEISKKMQNIVYLIGIISVSFTTLSYNAVISVPFNTIIVFIGSFIIAFIISKIPALNKWII